MKRFLGAGMLFAMLIMNGACKKNIGVTENEPLRTIDEESRINVAALTGEVADVLEEVYKDNRSCREVQAAIKSDDYDDERVLLKDLLLPSASALYRTENFKKKNVDTGVFARMFRDVVASGDYPLLRAELRSASLLATSQKPPMMRNDALLPVARPSVFTGTQLVSIYFPYSENFENLPDVSALPSDNKIAILFKPTIVFTDRESNSAPGRDPYYCPGTRGNICYRNVTVDDKYAEKNPTHIITIGATVRQAVSASVPKNDLVTRVYNGGSRLTRQMDKLISFTGNGGGSEIKICRINGYLRRTGERIDDFSGDVVTVNFSRGDIRNKRWKRIYSVWDPNWNYQDIEQIYTVYEEDKTGTGTIEGALTTNLTLPLKLGKTEGKIGFKIQVQTQDEIITQRKLDRKSFLRDGMNNQGWGYYPDSNDFLSGKDWPIFDGGAIWQYTVPYRIY